RPRDRNSAEFQALVEQIYGAMTGRPSEPARGAEPATPVLVPLPHASVDALSGFAEILAGSGPVGLGETASDLGLDVRDLLPLVDALVLLGFAEVGGDGHAALTPEGQQFAAADIQVSKRIFAGAAIERAPQVRLIVTALDKAQNQ